MNIVRKRKRFDIINYLPFLLPVIAVALIIALIAVLIPRDIKSIDKNQLTELPFTSESTFKTFAGGVVYIDNAENKLYYVDDRNEVMWGFSGASNDMALYTGVSKVGITLGKKLQVISLEGNLAFSKEFDRNISGVAIGEKLIAVSLSNSDDTIILNSTGEEIDRIVSGLNTTNICFGVYSTGSVWVISVENSGYSPEYRLSTYKYDTEKTQTVTFEEDSQMMYDAVFHNNLCYIFGTERLMVRDCDYTDTVNRDYSVNGYDVIAFGTVKKEMHILLANSGRIKAVGEKDVIDLECDEKLAFASVSDDGYFGFSSYFMYKFKIKNGKAKKYRFPVRIDDITQGDGYVIVKSGEQLFRYGLEA